MSQIKEHPGYRGSRWGNMQWFRRKLGDAHMSYCWMWIGVQCTESAGSVVLIATWLRLSTCQILAALQRFLCRFSKSSEPKYAGNDSYLTKSRAAVTRPKCRFAWKNARSCKCSVFGASGWNCNRLQQIAYVQMAQKCHGQRSSSVAHHLDLVRGLWVLTGIEK